MPGRRVEDRVAFGGLWRDRDFMTLWAGETISQIGSTVSRDALPLTAVLTLNASPAQLGLLGAAGAAPVLLVALFAGVWADRVPRRPIMIMADLGRAALLGTIPLAAAAGRLTVAQLFVIAALAGVLTVFFDIAYRSYVPALVARADLLEANSRLGASESVSEISGPPLAGVLVQTLGGPVAILVDAVSYLWSALCVGLIRRPEPPPRPVEERESVGHEMQLGLRTVLRTPLLRSPAAALVALSLLGNIIGATYYLYAVRTLHLQAAAIGLIIACGGLGSFPGSLLAGRLARRFGAGPLMIGVSFIGTFITLMIPLAHGPVVVAAGILAVNQFLGDMLRMIYLVNEVSLRQAVAPPELLGRVNGSVHFLAEGATPVGLLLGGLLAELIGVRGALVVASGGGAIAGLWLLASPVRHVREIPLEAPAQAPA